MNQSGNPSSIKSKKEITEALLHLMKLYPYNEITVKQIVLETSLVRKTFYRNFSSKDDVLNSHIASLLLDYVETVSKPQSDVFSIIFSFCNMNKELLKILYKNNIMYILLQNMNQIVPIAHAHLDQAMQNFPFSFGNLNPEYLLAFNIGAIYNVIAKWVEQGMVDSPDEITATLKMYLTTGLELLIANP